MKSKRPSFIKISPTQSAELDKYRQHRRFNAPEYISIKSQLLHNYCVKYNIQAVVMGVSGGIDSAVVYGLAKEAEKLGQIKLVLGATYPSFFRGVTNQQESKDLATKVVCERFSGVLYNRDISEIVKLLAENLSSDWAAGQIPPMVRAVSLASLTTEYNDKVCKTVILGTTNRDEGSYLGYVGKYSDGIVDVQVISDLHKSEVYKVAKELQIPEEILRRTPTGDMWTGESDEEIFGTDYDSVELSAWDRSPSPQLTNIDNLHNFNSHKYEVGSPAIHLDIYESGVQGGWPTQFETEYANRLTQQGDIIKPQFVSPMDFQTINFNAELGSGEECRGLSDLEVAKVFNVLKPDEVEQLKNIFDLAQKKPANIFGYTGTLKDEKSERASLYNVSFAKTLWQRVRSHINLIQQAEAPITAWNRGEVYRAVGINPLFRFIGYKTGGELTTHYDFPFEDGKYKSLYSLVLYLTTNNTGATLFIEDPQKNEWQKDYSDWPEDRHGKIIEKVLPSAGKALIFPHYLLHKSDIVSNEYKLIIRTDIMFEKIKYS